MDSVRGTALGLESAYRVGSLESGALLCQAYEAYGELHVPASISFEHAWFLLLALARRDELAHFAVRRLRRSVAARFAGQTQPRLRQLQSGDAWDLCIEVGLVHRFHRPRVPWLRSRRWLSCPSRCAVPQHKHGQRTFARRRGIIARGLNAAPQRGL